MNNQNNGADTLLLSKEKIKNIQVLSHSGILNIDEAREMVSKVIDEELAKLGYHFDFKNFKNRKKEGGTCQYYRINLRDLNGKTTKRQIKKKSLEDLKQAVYEYECKQRAPKVFTFKEVFEQLQDETLANTKPGTDRYFSVSNSVVRRKQDFARFFSGTEFANIRRL